MSGIQHRVIRKREDLPSFHSSFRTGLQTVPAVQAMLLLDHIWNYDPVIEALSFPSSSKAAATVVCISFIRKLK